MKQLGNKSYIKVIRALRTAQKLGYFYILFLNRYSSKIVRNIRKDVDELRYVIEVLRQKEAREQLPVIKMEIDYELVTLHDALLVDDRVEIIKAKERLEQLRVQWKIGRAHV